ncbi:CPCC family cysteine-rich protein [Caproicibacter sp.]|uniref:CPCC family cysteine-rich protein n=1 Tax=Caproicibacter sp. TaxID=2814884 RepID=UPI0039890C4B
MKKYTCPCCGYKTLQNEHEYDICPICFWEDDDIQFDDVDFVGGANDVSLRQAQKNYSEFGACQKNMLKHVRKPNQDDVKDSTWKPISNK